MDRTMVLADYNLERAKEVQNKLGDPDRFPAEFVDASRQEQVETLARKYQVDLIMNACDPVYNVPIFEAAFCYGCTYMDMAMSLSEPHPEQPYRLPGVKLGDYQFERASDWEKRGLLALVGMGVEPGMADVFARYAQDHLFDEIDEIGIRDGANLEVRGYEFAPNFSIWTTIEECLNPPVIWEQTRVGIQPNLSRSPRPLSSLKASGLWNASMLSTKRCFWYRAGSKQSG
jgi:saccharopine dehydrogenase (NAD+, L-lysine forming)